MLGTDLDRVVLAELDVVLEQEEGEEPERHLSLPSGRVVEVHGIEHLFGRDKDVWRKKTNDTVGARVSAKSSETRKTGRGGRNGLMIRKSFCARREEREREKKRGSVSRVAWKVTGETIRGQGTERIRPTFSPWPMNTHPRSTSSRSFLYATLSGTSVWPDVCGSRSPSSYTHTHTTSSVSYIVGRSGRGKSGPPPPPPPPPPASSN